MRLLHVVPTYLPATRYGGPIFAVHGLCRALAARGHAVEVFTTSIDGPTNSAVPHGVPVMLDGVKVRYFASSFMRRLSWAPALARALQHELKGTDVVHLHSVFLWPTWAAARLARKSLVPYVISPRGMLVKKLIETRRRWIKSAWIGLIEKSNLEHASAIHVTSTVEAAELERFELRLRRVAMVPNGVDEVGGASTNEPSEDVKALAREQPLILFFGRIGWVKGLDRLLQGFARSRQGTLAIVGTDYDGLAPRLSQLARELNIADRVRFVPRTVMGVDKELVFASARVFVLPSYSESFGNAVLEAMQRGLPAIVTSDVGAAEVVRDAGGGLVVDGDPESLGHAIDRLAGDPALARAMGEAGRRYVSEHYSWPSVAARMEALYESMREAKPACSTKSPP
jgi:glycosyltransferase involved in cell wall biosynthesis